MLNPISIFKNQKMKLILEKLKQIEVQKNIEILYACETGSRAWGFASPDSDYDIRFIYKHQTDWYLSLNEKNDFINISIKDDLDITGWDIKKCLQLIKGSNAALVERFQSPIIYSEKDNFKSEFNLLIEQCYSRVAVFYHHYSLAKKFKEEILDSSEFKLKSYFYLVRSLLSCKFIINSSSVVPMNIISLMGYISEDECDLINDLIKIKSTVNEKYMHPTEERLVKIVLDLFEYIEPFKNVLPAADFKSESLENFFLKTIK